MYLLNEFTYKCPPPDSDIRSIELVAFHDLILNFFRPFSFSSRLQTLGLNDNPLTSHLLGGLEASTQKTNLNRAPNFYH